MCCGWCWMAASKRICLRVQVQKSGVLRCPVGWGGPQLLRACLWRSWCCVVMLVGCGESVRLRVVRVQKSSVQCCHGQGV